MGPQDDTTRSERMKRLAGILWLVAALAAAAMSSADEAVEQQRQEQPTPRTGVGDVKRPEAAPPAEQEGEEKAEGPIDGGTEWKPVFDKMPAQSIGAIAIAPSDHAIVWAGTGETFIRSNVSIGNGVYRSTDAGRTWQHMGLEKTGRIGRVIIDPRDPNVVYVAALGTCYGPQPERGVFRTRDGGKSWERGLFVDENTGASDLAMDPADSRTLFAGTWQIDIKTWGRKSGGPGSGVWVTHDGGTKWKRLTHDDGLPESPLGKIAVAVAPSDSQRVYALIETGDKGSLWRSDNGGVKWKLVSHSPLLHARPHYYTRMLVMPDHANEVYFPSNSMGVTYDGGETTDQVDWAGDNHDMWADPANPRRMMIGSDGGVS